MPPFLMELINLENSIWYLGGALLLLVMIMYFKDIQVLNRMYRWMNLYSGTNSSLPSLPNVDQISKSCLRILGLNPGGMTLQGTNTYLVGTADSRILIDTSDGNSKYLVQLKNVLASVGCNEISDVLVTHGHYDHTGGIQGIHKMYPNCRIWKFFPVESSNSHLTNVQAKQAGYQSLENGQLFITKGATLRTIYTPGHTNDHCCFHLIEENALFSGDCILGNGTTVFEDLHDYMLSLQHLSQLELDTIYPGHGSVISTPNQVIQEYISHRNQREKQIMEILSTQSCTTIEEIVRKLYIHIPYQMKRAANKNVRKHLEKLLKDKKVSRDILPSINWITRAKEIWRMDDTTTNKSNY